MPETFEPGCYSPELYSSQGKPWKYGWVSLCLALWIMTVCAGALL